MFEVIFIANTLFYHFFVDTRYVSGNIILPLQKERFVIQNFLHKGLSDFYLSGDKSRIQGVHVKKIRLILARLDSICQPEDMNLPGFDFHKLSGNKKGIYAIKVNKNWRITFKFAGNYVYDVNYEDYH